MDPSSIQDDEVAAIVAFAFGNRIGVGGEVEPGPVNHQLARLVGHLHARTGAPTLAQWEIAHSLTRSTFTDARAMGSVHSIEPVVEPDGTVRYLNTTGVAQAAAERMRAHGLEPKAAVAVVAHIDHVNRCVAELERLGIRAGVPAEMVLPADYDPESGQPWTRTRERYLAHEATFNRF